MLADKPTEISRIKLKTWTRQPIPMISEHSAHLTPLSVDFRTWLCRYTYLLLLISMLWHRQAIFKSKGDKLCSSAEIYLFLALFIAVKSRPVSYIVFLANTSLPPFCTLSGTVQSACWLLSQNLCNRCKWLHGSTDIVIMCNAIMKS